MLEHKLLGFTTLDLGCPLSKDGSAIRENEFSNRYELALKFIRIFLHGS